MNSKKMKSFKKNKKKITALEIGDSWLKIVQADASKKEKVISKVIVKNIASFSDNQIAKEISDLSGEIKINSSLLTVAVPHYIAAIRNLEFPSRDPAEIKDIIELQVGKLTPFTKDEIVYDSQILESSAEGYSRVIVAIVQKDTIERCLRVLEKTGLNTEKIALSSEGLINWAKLVCKHEDEDKNPCAVVDIGSKVSDFEVILRNKFIFSRNISIGTVNLSDNFVQWEEKFVAEINNAIYAYQNEMLDSHIGRVVICGAEKLTQRLDEIALRKKLDIPVEVAPVFMNVPATKEFLQEYDSNLALKEVSITAVCGLALAFKEQKINLIPQEIKMERAVRERGRDLYRLGINLIFVLVIISSIFLGRIYNKELYVGQLTQKIRGLQSRVEKLDNMVKEIEVIRQRRTRRNNALEVIYAVHKVILPEIYLLSVNFDGKERLSIRGTSENMSEVFRLVSSLEDTKHFQNVKTKYATKRKAGDKELTDFEIACPLKKD